MSLNRASTGIFPASTIMRETQLLKHHTLIHIQVKIGSILQKLTLAKLPVLLLKLLISQVHLMTQMIDVIYIQLDLRKKLFPLTKPVNLLEMKQFHVAVNSTYDPTLIETGQSHTIFIQVTNNQIVQQALEGSDFTFLLFYQLVFFC